MASNAAVTQVDLSQYNIKKIASGKVREIFEIDDKTLLFVATDRISAYDVILNNVSISVLLLISITVAYNGLRDAVSLKLFNRH